jgi:hypothetical protein
MLRMLGLPATARKENDMSRQRRHPHREPAVLTVDTGSTGTLTRRFLTLVVQPKAG